MLFSGPCGELESVCEVQRWNKFLRRGLRIPKISCFDIGGAHEKVGVILVEAADAEKSVRALRRLHGDGHGRIQRRAAEVRGSCVYGIYKRACSRGSSSV